MVGPCQPGGSTRAYAVLGHPISHTLSPVMHNAAFAHVGLDGVYLAFDVEPDWLGDVLTSLGRMNVGGVNLTVPLKERAVDLMARLDASAQAVGAVNTVEFSSDGMVGHNTDGSGFVRAVEEFAGGVAGKKVVVMGSGGAARAATLFSARAGAKSVTVAARNRSKADALVHELSNLVESVPLQAVTDADDQVEAVRAGELLIQSTPVGLQPDDPPLYGAEAFREGQAMLDMIYHVAETSTMKVARQAGAAVANGLGMLLHQGAQAFELWTGQEAPVEVMRGALREAVYGC